MTDPSEEQNNGDRVIALVGINGWVAGECYTLKPGDDIVIGRSRSCDVSLRRCQTYLSKSRYDRDNDHDFNTVSRKHLHVTAVDETYVRLEDLSTNGTYIDDVLMSDSVDVNANEQQVKVRLGTRETVQVRLLNKNELAERQQEAAAAGDSAEGSGFRPHSDIGAAPEDEPLEFEEPATEDPPKEES